MVEIRDEILQHIFVKVITSLRTYKIMPLGGVIHD